MADIATLGIAVDSRDVLTASDSLDKLTKSGGKADTQTTKLNKTFSGTEVATKAAKAGIAGVVTGVTTLAAAVAKGTVDFAEYEKGMIGVQKTTDFSAQEMGLLENEILKISRSVPIATTSLLGIAETAGQLGVTGVDNIANFTETLGKLELATDVIGEEGAKSIARLLTVTGDGIETVDAFGSVLVALGNNSAASESEILSLATEVGMATSTFSVSATEAAAMGAAMKSMGVRAELGGSVVGRAMRTIEAAINDGGESMTLLQETTGMTADELEKGFGDNATLVFKKWVEGIGNVVEGGTSAADALGAFGLKGEEILKVLPTMAVNSSVLTDSLDLMNDELESGTALNDEAAKAASGLSAQWQIAKNILSEITVAIGKENAPAMKAAIGQFREWWEINNEIVKQDIAAFFDKAFKTIATSIGYITDSVGVVKEAWTTISNFIGYTIGDILIGWEDYLYAVDRGLLAIKSSFGITFDKVLEIAASAIDLMAQGFDKIPVVGDEMAASMNSAAESMRGASTATEDYSKDVDLLRSTHENLVSTLTEEQTKYLTVYREAESSTTNRIALSNKLKGIVVSNSNEQTETQKQNYIDVVETAEDTINTTADYFSELKDNVIGDGGSSTEMFSGLTMSFGELEEQGIYSLLDGKNSVKSSFSTLNTDAQDLSSELFGATSLDVQDFTLVTQDELLKNPDSALKTWGNFTEGAAGAFGTFATNVIEGDFNNIGDAWTSLWKGMLSTVVDTVAEMGAKFVVDKVVSSFFHDGTMGLKEDEYNAVLKAGEIVIPADESQQIRDNMELNGTSSQGFEGMVDATSKYSSAVSAADPFGMSSIGRVGEHAGGVVGRGVVGLSGLGATPGAKSVGAEIGAALMGYGAEAVADLANVRDMEGLRDAVEAGYVSKAQGYAMAREDATKGIDRSTGFSSIAATVDHVATDVKGFASKLGRSMMDKAEAGLAALAKAEAEETRAVEGYGDYEGETGLGIGQEGIGLEGGGPDADGGGHGERGGGNEGTSEPGGIGGYNKGGIVNQLMLPQGEDGFAALQYGESVNDVEATNMLKEALKSGGLSGDNTQLAELVRSLGINLLRIATDSNRMLSDWDNRGLPATRT